ncbi:transporter protein smf2 [Patellaria atrata CBS 101060]|uniref:Transporter protein smf2 n=1 Tax=Patellaria atrata CBS 101060 TaxID=1346257 RepID=A0A9P4VQM5_9PEZI|nr:transporter protein smf2 [Patellaria atrata CBS 101060]
MNCPSRPDADVHIEGWNQNPSDLAADTTTRNDLNHIANSRQQRGHRLDPTDPSLIDVVAVQQPEHTDSEHKNQKKSSGKKEYKATEQERDVAAMPTSLYGGSSGADGPSSPVMASLTRAREILVKYSKFVGPGFMVAVAYIDPGNYATDVAAGATYRFKLLFIILMSNLFAIFLQALCVKLGTVTGMNLAENCKAHLPSWLNYVLYFFAESAIIATDIAEVIGTAIALNVLINVPLVAGCAISIVDVLIILLFYRPQNGSMKALRAFEFFVMALVLGVVICFCFQLSLIENTSVKEVFRGYLPSHAVVESKGLLQSCGILGATVMPHSLYLGSGIVQPRLKEFDVRAGAISPSHGDEDDPALEKYRPSISAIRACMKYSIIECAISLFTFALFVNSSILIVAGASLSNTPAAEDADLFAIHDLLARTLAPVAGTIFALALLLSGTSAGIVCTIAGQMVSEGQLNWTVAPWVRRLITRAISITPSIIIAGAVGKQGLSRALEGSQVALSVILPFVSAPLIYFTCRNSVMTVATDGEGEVVGEGEARVFGGVKMRNGWVTIVVAGVIWGIIVVMNVALLVLVGLGIE